MNSKRITYAAYIAAAVLIVLGVIVAVRENRLGPKAELTVKDFLVMNTIARISTDGSPADADAAVGTVRLLESRVSSFIKSSDISHVNDWAGSYVLVDSMTYEDVALAVRWARATNGAFDPTVGPIVRLWHRAARMGSVPSSEDIEAARNLVDYRKVDLSRPNEIALEGAGMRIDLGGIAKGYAADLVATQLRALGVKHALIDLGGNVMTVGGRPDGQPWTIGIQLPGGKRGESICALEVSDESVVTSGPYERFITINGKMYNHIFDPRTGMPVSTNLASVTVLSKKSVDGDALSTAFSVMGVDGARKFIASHKGYDAIFVVASGDKFKIIMTPGAKKSFREIRSDIPSEVLEL